MFSLLNKEVKNLIVFDLEWNQSSFHTNHRIPHEIIEIGACRVSREGNVLDRFSRLIRPRVYQKLDKHIKQVTGITEDELANGKPFSDVFGDFIAWCGEDVQLVTWGRDDYPVLKRNAAFFMTPMPFEPPMDAQLIFGFCCLGGAHQQMNLHAAMEKMEIELDAPAHRAVYDAECTAALLGKIDEALCVLPPERRMQLDATLEKEKRIAASALRSLPTPYMYQTDALADQKLMGLPCPACGKRTAFDTPWFDSGREKYMAISVCPQHGFVFGQMHFKRTPSNTLIMHQRAYPASMEDVEDVRERYRLYQLIPQKKRHHRLNMEDVVNRTVRSKES